MFWRKQIFPPPHIYNIRSSQLHLLLQLLSHSAKPLLHQFVSSIHSFLDLIYHCFSVIPHILLQLQLLFRCDIGDLNGSLDPDGQQYAEPSLVEYDDSVIFSGLDTNYDNIFDFIIIEYPGIIFMGAREQIFPPLYI